jgi:hypothetical protein
LPQAFPPLGAEYERFLYAVVCEEPNGAVLTMVSAIARSGADPWREAARIAKLPKAAAFEALGRLIPDRGDADKTAIANRLFALLPTRRLDKPFDGPLQPASASAAKTVVAVQNPLVLIVVVLILAVITGLYFKTQHQSGVDSQTTPMAPPMADKSAP